MEEKNTDTHEDEHIELEADEEFETTDEEGGEVAQKDKLKQLRTKLQAAEEAKRASLEELQRTKADFLNSKKRLEEQQVQAIARAEGKFVTTLLPLADSFAMAMKDTAAWEAIDEAWRKGVEGIYQQLQRILTEHDVVAVDPTGQPFDPELHEAVGTVEHEAEADTVVEVLQVGYERNGVLLRPAKVVISSQK